MFALRYTPLLALALALTQAVPAQQTQLTLGADADTYVDEASPNTNFNGTLSAFQLQMASAPTLVSTFGDCRTLVSFDLSGISNIQINSATLRLNPSGSGVVDVQRVTSSWQENSVVWNNQPTFDSQVMGSVSVRAGQSRTVDVTATVQEWLSGAQPNHGFVLILQDAGPLGAMASMPSREAQQGAKLVVNFDQFRDYGSSCGFQATTSGTPVPGSSFTIRGSGGRASTVPGRSDLALLAVGTAMASLPIGVSGHTGCEFLTSMDVVVPMPFVNGEFEVTVPVPASPSLVGSTVYQQAIRAGWAYHTIRVLGRNVRVLRPELTVSQGIAVTISDA